MEKICNQDDLKGTSLGRCKLSRHHMFGRQEDTCIPDTYVGNYLADVYLKGIDIWQK